MKNKNDVIELIKRVTDDNILYEAFYQEEDEKIKEAILEKTKSERLIEEVVKNKSFSSNLRCIAVSKCNFNLNLKMSIIEDICEDSDVRKVAMNSLSGVCVDWHDWYKLYQKEPKCNLKLFLIKEKITNQNELLDIVFSSTEKTSLKEEAIKKIEDDEILISILASKNVTDEIKNKAFHKISDFEKVMVNILNVITNCEESSILNCFLERLFEYNNQELIADILIELKQNKLVVEKCFKVVNDKELLNKIYKEANFWYTKALALEKLK